MSRFNIPTPSNFENITFVAGQRFVLNVTVGYVQNLYRTDGGRLLKSLGTDKVLITAVVKKFVCLTYSEFHLQTVSKSEITVI